MRKALTFFAANENLNLTLYFLQVDLVTMLEKAISYVKFLQLQVKVYTFPFISLIFHI